MRPYTYRLSSPFSPLLCIYFFHFLFVQHLPFMYIDTHMHTQFLKSMSGIKIARKTARNSLNILNVNIHVFSFLFYITPPPLNLIQFNSIQICFIGMNVTRTMLPKHQKSIKQNKKYNFVG